MNSDVTAFWNRACAELAQIDPAPAPEQSGREYATQAIAVRSLGGVCLRGWYSVPHDRPRGGRLPAVLAVPGYGGEKPIPTHVIQAGFAVLTLFPCGQGESKRDWQLPEGVTKLTYFPSAWRPPVHQLVAVGPLRVRVRLSEGVLGRSDRLLVSGQEVTLRSDDGCAAFEVGTILDPEVVVIL